MKEEKIRRHNGGCWRRWEHLVPWGPGPVTHYTRVRAWGHLRWQKGVAGAMAPQHWACGNYLGAGAWVNCFHPLKAWLSVFK